MMAKDADIIPQSGHVRLVGALAGFGSGITKVASSQSTDILGLTRFRLPLDIGNNYRLH